MFNDSIIYTMIGEIQAEIAWSPGWPKTFQGIDESKGIGCWKLQNNSVAASTSTRREQLTRISVQLQTWAVTPEKRLEYEQAIDQVFGSVLRRSNVAKLEETLAGTFTAYRSIMTYEGRVDSDTLFVYQ